MKSSCMWLISREEWVFGDDVDAYTTKEKLTITLYLFNNN